MGSNEIAVALAIACLACTALTTIPHTIALNTRYYKTGGYRMLHETYQDRDGDATTESEAAFSNTVPRWVLLLSSIAGAVSGLALCIIETIYSQPLQLAPWVFMSASLLITAQAVMLFLASPAAVQYSLGKWTALASILLVVSAALALRFEQGSILRQHQAIVYLGLQIASAAVVCVTGILFQRRPNVFYKGRLVDRQNTTSFLGKWTYAWASDAIRLIAQKEELVELDELPMIASDFRAEALCNQFEKVSPDARLWKRIFDVHKVNIAAIWTLQLTASALGFVPELLLFLLLQQLERRGKGENVQVEMWVIALGLGLMIAFNDWLDSFLWYISGMKIRRPLQIQLSTAIFGKSVRAKNIHGATDSNGESSDDDNSVDGNSETEDGGDQKKTKQSVINLMSIDSERVADFASAGDLFLDSLMSLIIAVFFLVQIIGWVPMLSGLAVPLLLSPLNLLISRRYMKTEDDLMSVRDAKMAMVGEALQGIRQIKFSALEGFWYSRVMQLRRKELRRQWKVFLYEIWLTAIWELGPICLSAVSLAVYALRNGSLTASVAFTSISIFESLESSLAMVPGLVSDLMDSLVSARRIEDYLKSPEQSKNTEMGESVVLKNATLAWPSNERTESEFKLYNLCINFAMAQLNVISGKTGSGKSLLLAGIIGEADILSGEVVVPSVSRMSERPDGHADMSDWIVSGSIAYVDQNPWIENASFRENILFQLPYNEDRYRETIEACALDNDLELLTDGDRTEIGVNGINLSGGQKWRVSFARALYSRAAILVMDDIFSAVDAHVGRHLYEKALTGKLSHGRTRILVTHHAELCLPSTQYSILLDNGSVTYAERTDKLRRDGLIKDFLKKTAENENEDTDSVNPSLDSQPDRPRRDSCRNDTGKNLLRQRSHASEDLTAPREFTTKESREIGRVKFAIYREFIKACRGFWYWIFVAAMFFSVALISIARSYWVTIWTRDVEARSGGSGLTNVNIYMEELLNSQYSYALVYAGISIVAWIVTTARYLAVFYGSIYGARILFERMTGRILQAPVRFFDVTPIGRINNRFSSDFADIDSRIANGIGWTLCDVISILSVILAALFVSPYMAILIAFFILVAWYFASKYIQAARQVHRLESITRSPILEQFGSFLTGVATVRAFDRASVYIGRMNKLINDNVVPEWHLALFNRWLDLRLNLIGATFTFVTAALVVGVKNIDASLAGFVLSFSLQLSDGIIGTLKHYSAMELSFNAMERVVEYSSLDSEPQDGLEAPAAWPQKGEVEVSDLVAAYASDLPPVLHGLSFSVRQHQRVGIVGRTGAGKSSLSLALFRFIDWRSGSIYIDGIDVSKIKLENLRSRLAIIPQSPVLFSGTIRGNLDPSAQYTDAELREALVRVKLAKQNESDVSDSSSNGDSTITEVDEPQTKFTLSTTVAEGGSNFSQGQRQLLCLARAIVSRPKIMVLDEATSSVDMETDALIQASIREDFHSSTLLVIAHRLSTVADFDRILVMNEGKALEFGTPLELMQKQSKDGFWGLVMESGERATVEETIYGKSNAP